MASQDGRGRTLFQMLTGRNRKDMTSQELKRFNPLGLRCGSYISFDHDPDLKGNHFRIARLRVNAIEFDDDLFEYTDYELVGPDSVRLTLRVSNPDGNQEICLCRTYMNLTYRRAEEMGLVEALSDPQGEFRILQEVDGTSIPDELVPVYWRVDDHTEPYTVRSSILEDRNGDGTVEESEIRETIHRLWDFHRDTTQPLRAVGNLCWEENAEILSSPCREWFYAEEEIDEYGACLGYRLFVGRQVFPAEFTLI